MSCRLDIPVRQATDKNVHPTGQTQLAAAYTTLQKKTYDGRPHPSIAVFRSQFAVCHERSRDVSPTDRLRNAVWRYGGRTRTSIDAMNMQLQGLAISR